MKKFKELYSFTVPKITFGEEKLPSTLDGQEVTITKKVEKSSDVPFCLKRPTRAMFDDAEVYYNVNVSQGLERGLVSATLLAKKFMNAGGIFSEEEKNHYGEKFKEYFIIEDKIRRKALKPESERSEGEKEEIENLVKSLGILTKDLQEYELRQQNLFSITAESFARTRTVIWWFLQLVHKKNEEGEWVLLFPGKTDAEKEESYDDLDDEDLVSPGEASFYRNVIVKSQRAVTFWYYNRNAIQEDFDKDWQTFQESLKLTQ